MKQYNKKILKKNYKMKMKMKMNKYKILKN